MDYKGKPRRELPSDTSLPDELNAFYACFEASNTESCTRAPAVLDDCWITLSVVFTDIFNLSLNESIISTFFKQTTIVPVHREAKVTCRNDYRSTQVGSH